MTVELEHGMRDEHTNVGNDDAISTARIAFAHLNELPDYYTRLERMEADTKLDSAAKRASMANEPGKQRAIVGRALICRSPRTPPVQGTAARSCPLAGGLWS